MKLIRKLLFIIFLITVNLLNGQDWVEISIADIGTIEFPGEVYENNSQGVVVYDSEDENAFYVVTVMRYNEGNLDENRENLDEFYEGNVKGMLDASEGKLLIKKKIVFQNLPALEFEFTTDKNPQLPSLRYTRIIYVSPYMVGINFWPKTDNKSLIQSIKSKFYNSLNFDLERQSESSISEVNKIDRENRSDSYNLGIKIGEILFYVLILGFIGLLLIFLFVKRNRKNKRITLYKRQGKPDAETKIVCSECGSENTIGIKYCTKCGFAL